MSTIVASAGGDTWVRDDRPNRNMAGGNTIRVQQTHRRGFIHIPVTDIRGRTVLAATLTGHAKGAFAAQTVTVAAVTDSWAAGKTTWNNQPGVGATVATACAAAADGDAIDLDVTALLQAVSNGTKWRGFRLTTNDATDGDCYWYAFDSPNPSWALTIELSDAPEQPSDLRPNIGAVGSPAPVLAWSYTDLGGDSSEQGAFRVQADPAANETTPAFDTGWVTSGDPQYDLSSGTFTPLASGASTQWRVATKDAAGNISDWSDWAAFSYEPYFALTMDSPTGGTIGDSTPDIIAHITGETLTQWRARVLDASGDVLWNSGLNDGAISITVPKRNDDGERVIRRDDATYTIQVRAWGDVDRADAVGLPAYVEALTDVVFDDDAGVTTPTAFTVTQFGAGDPRATFSWSLPVAPDAVLLLRNGEIAERLDSDDWSVSAGTYTWVGAVSTPFVTETWEVRAVSGGARSPASAAVDYTANVTDVWLVPDDGLDPIRLELPPGAGKTGSSIDQFAMQDRRAVFKPLNSGTNVSIVYGFEGASGNFIGILSDRQDQAAAASRLESLRRDVYARPRLVWGISIPVELSNLKCLPAADHNGVQSVWNVSFDFLQDGD